MSKILYVTTTLPYVNAKPHIGHAREFVQADVFARAHQLLGYEVFFNTGTDEHGQKILEKAQEAGKDVQEYANEQAQHFVRLCKELKVEYSNFIRTTDAEHVQAAQKFWQLVEQKGHIYKKNYRTKYCVGCELEKTDSELVEGKCPDHPNKELEVRDEENYFFKFSAFQKQLLELFEKDPGFVRPAKRFNEIRAFAEKGLEDFSISRLKEKMSWGIEVPGDPEHVMYVWFDALTNYISTLGWPYFAKASKGEPDRFEKFWGTADERKAVQFCGKDNLRQQSAMWQAMLMAAGLPNSKRIYVNGFINSGGQKMSKSLGNVISPFDMAEKYGADATRYLLLAIGSFGEDTDITWEKLDEKYNADLANGIGNLTSRIVTLYKKADYEFELEKGMRKPFEEKSDIKDVLESGKLELELESVMEDARILDRKVESERPWELVKSDPEAFRASIEGLVRGVYYIALRLEPFMPEASNKIKESLLNKEKTSLFPRLKLS